MNISKHKATREKVNAEIKSHSSAKSEKTLRVKTKAYARFDARLSQEQKDLFEKAAKIKGFKSLSEFVIYYTSEAATFIIEKHNQIIATERDRNIFFDALVNAPKPNAALIKASKLYKKQVAQK